MANELRWENLNALTVVADPWIYAVVHRVTDNYVWNNSAGSFEAFNAANYASYAVPLALTASGEDRWAADLPALPAGGTYEATYYARASSNATPLTSDTIVGASAAFAWNGVTTGVPVPAGGWRYSDRAHVLALVGGANAAVIWDLDNA